MTLLSRTGSPYPNRAATSTEGISIAEIDTEEKTKSLHSMTMGKVGVILPHEITFAISILMSFVLGSASLLLFTLYAHRNYLMNTVLTFNSSDIHPLLKWIVTTRQQHSRMYINRMSYY